MYSEQVAIVHMHYSTLILPMMHKQIISTTFKKTTHLFLKTVNSANWQR